MRGVIWSCTLLGLALAETAHAATLDFMSVAYPPLPPADQTIVVSDSGVDFTFVPTDNLVGAPRWVGGDRINFGGGGGSSLEFEFTPDFQVTLDSYTIGLRFHLGNPNFRILEGANVLSASNDADVDGTFAFDSGPISLDPGVTYTFETNQFGAAIQSAFTAWDFTVIPEPSSAALLALAAFSFVSRTSRRRRQTKMQDKNA